MFLLLIFFLYKNWIKRISVFVLRHASLVFTLKKNSKFQGTQQSFLKCLVKLKMFSWIIEKIYIYKKKTKVQRERNRNKNKCLLFISFLLFLRFSFYKNLVDKYFLLSMFKVSFSCHDILFLYDPWPIIEFLYKQYMHMMPWKQDMKEGNIHKNEIAFFKPQKFWKIFLSLMRRMKSFP
jgi:hypothetical protein